MGEDFGEAGTGTLGRSFFKMNSSLRGPQIDSQVIGRSIFVLTGDWEPSLVFLESASANVEHYSDESTAKTTTNELHHG